MDFFQGSLPPNFISFCLDNQNPDELQVQTTNTIDNSAGAIQRPVPISVSGYVPGVNPSPPPFPPIRAARDQTEHIAADISFHGAASAVIYAGQGLQRMGTMQGLAEANSADNVEEDPNAAQGQLAQIADHDAEFVRSSTPNPPDQPGTSVDSLTQLETSLSVTPKMSTGFPELQVLQDQTEEMPEVSFLQSEGDASSSVMEPPPLPGGKIKLKILASPVMSIKHQKTLAKASAHRYMPLILWTLHNNQKLEMNQAQKFTIRASPAHPELTTQVKTTLYETCQGGVEPP